MSPPLPSVARRGDRATLRRGLRVLGVAVREQPLIFGLAVACSAVYGTTTVAQAWVLGQVVDRVAVPSLAAGQASTAALVATLGVIVGVSTLKAAGIVGRRLGAGVMQYRLQASFRRRVTRQYLQLPLSWHHRHPTGQLLSNANADVEATWFVIAPLPMAVGTLIMLVVGAVAMLATDLLLACVALLVFPAIFGLNVLYQRQMSPLVSQAQQLRAEVSEVAHESFDGALLVKAMGHEAQETARFRAVSQQLRDAQTAVGRVRGVFDPVMDALPSLGVLAVLLLGSWQVQRGVLAAGDLVQAAYLFTLLAFPVRSIGWVLGELPRSVVGWERLRAVLDARGGLAYAERDLEGSGAVTVEARRLGYAYDDPAAPPADDRELPPAGPALRDVTLDVPAGRTVAVVGPTGAGKSTLTTLLLRLMDPTSGQVLLSGTDLREIRRGGVAGAAALVPQQTFLFDDTARANVTLDAGYDDAQVWAALRLAQADGFVAALPEGLDTTVGERGATLSGGQRQRLALARALVRRPRLLVLDDATSSVDPLVEAAILRGLRAADLPSTVVVVAYRPATIALADEAVFLDRGQILDRGPHTALLVRSPGYRALVTAYERRERDGRRRPTGTGGSPQTVDAEVA